MGFWAKGKKKTDSFEAVYLGVSLIRKEADRP